jgi:hypothetical protein
MDCTDWCVIGSNSSPEAAICFYSATKRVIGSKYYFGMATDFGFARNGWSGVASAGRKKRLKATESGSPTRNSRCFWAGLIWRERERKIGIDTKKKTSKQLVISTVFLLVFN